MKDILDKMLRDSRHIFVPEGLQGRQQLLDQLARQTEPWKGLTPIQNFFLFEVAPDKASKAPAAVVRDAYCAALESLPGEWFTPFSSLSTGTSKRLLAITDMDACLVRQLDNQKEVDFGDSEAHANASLAHYQVGDLAALFLGARHKLDYDIRAPLAARITRRGELKRQLGTG